ncbi:MAG: response regulator [Kofleriaceae bacterium]|nr:response regulator [Kofleriaceae bacterium]
MMDRETTEVASNASARVLIIDDSIMTAEILGETLEEEGYEVLIASSGMAGLAMLESQSIDCVLLDLEMPDMSGTETCERIKDCSAWRTIPVAMLTAHEDPGLVVKTLDAGADNFFCKSDEMHVICARVRALLRRKLLLDENQKMREQLHNEQLKREQVRASLLAEVARKNTDLERANAELEHFAHTASHDLQAPLRHIWKFSEILLEDEGAKLSHEGRDNLNYVIDACARMRTLIDDLLALSQITFASKPDTICDLDEVMQCVISDLKLQAGESNARIECDPLPTITADKTQMRQLLQNLVSNGLKYQHQTNIPVIKITCHQSEHLWIISVEDNGIGFSSSNAKEIFEPFRRLHSSRNYKGTGLGLATCLRIVQRHGGKISAKSTPGCGATFTITLPVGSNDVAPTSIGQKGDCDNGPRPMPLLLLVDDDHTELVLVQKLLANDFRIETVESAEQAMELLSKNTYDVIITDNRMSGKGGIWLLEQVQHLYPGVRRILTSSKSPLMVDDKIRDGIVEVFFPKTLSLESVRNFL